jgi:predicted lipoprotein with Yx(FWY)xxD motif
MRISSNNHNRQLRIALLGAATSILLLAGCGSSSSSSTTTTKAPATSTTATSTPATSTPATSAPTTSSTSTSAPEYKVQVASISGLGDILVDGEGRTLYLFEPDRQSGQSTCYNGCADGWPPLLLPSGVSSAVAGTGVTASLLGTTHRTDGTVEVTYNKWPLYLWIGDSGPGQATGQALDNDGGLWYVVSPSGNAITTAS